MNGMAADEKLGLGEPEKKETIIVDFGGANVAKPLHVGHLRSAVIGESVKRMGRFLGHNVIGDAFRRLGTADGPYYRGTARPQAGTAIL